MYAVYINDPECPQFVCYTENKEKAENFINDYNKYNDNHQHGVCRDFAYLVKVIPNDNKFDDYKLMRKVEILFNLDKDLYELLNDKLMYFEKCYCKNCVYPMYINNNYIAEIYLEPDEDFNIENYKETIFTLYNERIE